VKVHSEIRVTGTVQGVGFRPFVYRLAEELGLAGSVRNTAAGVVIEVEGEEERVREFVQRVREEAPALARIASMEARELEPAGLEGFRIVESEGAPRPTALIPPDVALCADCAREIADPRDRRFGYPFTNCTNCGPRFTIVRGIPYDRRQTTMAAFEMCGECAREYGDPRDRRFHAEPVACPRCGPRVRLEEGGGSVVAGVGTPALQQAARLLREGKVVAIKGLGGYHLACDARNAEAVETLRRRKGRGQKPFAIMARDLEEARRVAEVSPRAAALLTSPESPVVIMPARPGSGLAEGIAPRQHTVGVMLPYTPLHRLLLDASPSALVMTSGNLAEEPIVHEDEEARRKLGPIADFMLSHDREIAVPCDDSVVRVEGELVIPVRRARGYVPRSAPVAYEGPPVLAVGGHHKSTFCLLREGEAILSQHTGDLDTVEVLDYFGRAVRHFEELFEVRPEIVAHDLHPGYLSTQWAKSLEGVRLVGVQHHHAHVVSVMAELGLAGPVIGVAYDGTGYGPDGTAWGGEILVADRREYRRAFHLWQVQLPGGEAAIARPGRMALSWLMAAFGAEEGMEKARRLLPEMRETELQVVGRQIERRINSPMTSSMGRLFDAVGALLGATAEATYEGQAAMESEGMVTTAGGHAETCPPYSYGLEEGVTDTRPVIRDVIAELERGVERGVIAARFHETVAAFTVEACRRIREEGGPGEVVLCGGVMQNARLVGRLLELLKEAGLRAYVHREVPPNDGGMSLGQAVVAAG
jgi:hydrogenase maturation protein HypF